MSRCPVSPTASHHMMYHILRPVAAPYIFIVVSVCVCVRVCVCVSTYLAAFNESNAMTESSGSPGRCTIANDATSACEYMYILLYNGTYCIVTIATWALTGTLSAILLVLACVCVSCCCYCKCRHKKLMFVNIEGRPRGGSIWDWLHMNRRAEYPNLLNNRRNDDNLANGHRNDE